MPHSYFPTLVPQPHWAYFPWLLKMNGKGMNDGDRVLNLHQVNLTDEKAMTMETVRP